MPKPGSPVNKNHVGHTALQACTPRVSTLSHGAAAAPTRLPFCAPRLSPRGSESDWDRGTIPSRCCAHHSPDQREVGIFQVPKDQEQNDEEETSSLGINLMRGLGVPWVCQFQAGCEKGSGRTSSLTLSGKFSGVQSPSQELEPASCHPGWPQDPTRTAQMCPR